MKLLLICISCLTIYAMTSCNKSKTTSPAGNLILNPGFEKNGEADFTYWTGTKAFSNDVPTDGGNWSLQLEPLWYPAEGYAETSVSGLAGDYNFKFACETKAENGTGRIILRKKDSLGQLNDLLNVSFNDSTWTTRSETFQTQLNPADTLIVHLSAGSTELSLSKFFFDNVQLRIINP